MHPAAYYTGACTVGLAAVAYLYFRQPIAEEAKQAYAAVASALQEAPPASPSPTPAARKRGTGHLAQALSWTTPEGPIKLERGAEIEYEEEGERSVVTTVKGTRLSIPKDALAEQRAPLRANFESPATAAPADTATADKVEQPKADPPAVGVNRFARSLLIVTGDQGSGTASIIRVGGKPVIVTNAHVLSGNSTVSFRALDGKALPVERVGISSEYDLAIAEAKDLGDALELAENLDSTVAVGDDVVVLGNSQGSGVVTEIPGKVTGLGPSLIEVDAKFVEGNSGSPIVHSKTGKVIAIATFAKLEKLTSLSKDSQFTEVRRFGYRVDTATAWEYPRWSRFTAEAKKLEEIKQGTNDLLQVAMDIYENGHVSHGRHEGPKNYTRNVVIDYLQKIDGARYISPTNIIETKQRLLRSLAALTRQDFLSFDTNALTGYHRKIAETELQKREFLREKFLEIVNLQTAEKKIRMR